MKIFFKYAIYLSVFLSLWVNPIIGIFTLPSSAAVLLVVLRDLAVFTSIVLTIPLALSKKEPPIELIGLILIYISVLISSIIGNIDNLSTYMVFIRNYLGFFTIYVLFRINNFSFNRVFITTNLVFFLLLAILELLYIVTGNDFMNDVLNKHHIDQAKGVMSNIDLGLFSSFRLGTSLLSPSQAGIFLVAILYSYSVEKRFFQITFNFVTLVLILLTVSKTAFLMLSVLIIRKLFNMRLALVACIGFLILPYLADGIVNMIEGRHISSIKVHFSGYVEAWRIVDHPFGLGLGNSGTVARTLGNSTSTVGMESGFGSALGSLGVPFLIALLFFVIAAFSKPDKLAGLFCLFFAAFLFNENALSPHLWIFPMAMLYSKLESETNDKQFKKVETKRDAA